MAEARSAAAISFAGTFSKILEWKILKDFLESIFPL